MLFQVNRIHIETEESDMKKITALLAAVILLFVSATACAGSHSSDISSVMLNFTLSNSSCKSAVQQAVNGLYRSVELLELITRRLSAAAL